MKKGTYVSWSNCFLSESFVACACLALNTWEGRIRLCTFMFYDQRPHRRGRLSCTLLFCCIAPLSCLASMNTCYLILAWLSMQVEHDELLHICFHKLRSFPRRKLQWLQQTAAAGLGDPCKSAPQQQQQQPQLEEQQLNRQISRRSRLLSFGRVSRQQSACEVTAHPLTRQSSRWRQKLPKVNIGMRRREAPTTNRQRASSYGGSNAPEESCAASDHGSSNSRLRSMGIHRSSVADGSGRPKEEQQRQQQERG